MALTTRWRCAVLWSRGFRFETYMLDHLYESVELAAAMRALREIRMAAKPRGD
jgi:hypothetical protein